MTISDYITLGLALTNILYLFAHKKLTKKSLESALYNNRTLLAQALEDILTKFGAK